MLNHNYIGTEHLLLGLLREGQGVASGALTSMGVDLEMVRSQVEDIIGQGQASQSGHIPFTPRAKKVLELSLREAHQLGHDYIGTEHILLGLIREGEGVAAQVLQKLGGDLNRVRAKVMEVLAAPEGIASEQLSEGLRYLGRYAFSEDGWLILERAHDAAHDLGHRWIDPADFLLAVMTFNDSVVAELLSSWGVDIDDVRARIEELAGEEEDEEDGGPGSPGPT